MTIIIDNSGSSGGGGGGVNPGVVPQHAYYDTANTVASDSNQQKGALGTQLRAVEFVLDFMATDNYYVDPVAGNDANPGTLALPFQTIGRAMRQVAANIRPGAFQVNLANGTYNELLFVQDMMGCASDPDYGNSVIKVVGNIAAPNLCEINVAAGPCVYNISKSAVLYLDGVNLVSGGAIGTYGVYANGSRTFLNNVSIDGPRVGIQAEANAEIRWISGAAGGTVDAVTDGIVLKSSYFRTDRNLVLQGVRTSGATIKDNSCFELSTFASSFQSTGDLGAGGCSYNLLIQSGGVFRCPSSVTFDLENAISGPDSCGIKTESGGLFEADSGCIFNFTNDTRAGQLDDDSTIKIGTGAFFNYLGGTASEWRVSDSSNLLNGSVAATASIIDNSTNGYKYGHDFRYVDTVAGLHSGKLPDNVTRYVNFSQLQGNYIPIYIATRDEVIVRMDVITRVSNGAGNTDTYTVVRNGVDQAMTLSITNATFGQTVANPVSLIDSDTVGIKVETDVVTAAEDMIVQLVIQKVN